MITAEIQANNAKATALAEEQGMKVAQNVAAGVVGLVIWPVWFAMDTKGAAGTDAAALKGRQEYARHFGTLAISTARASGWRFARAKAGHLFCRKRPRS